MPSAMQHRPPPPQQQLALGPRPQQPPFPVAVVAQPQQLARQPPLPVAAQQAPPARLARSAWQLSHSLPLHLLQLAAAPAAPSQLETRCCR